MTTIGRVEYEANIDGKRLPAQARAVGRSLGSEMGKTASAAFNSDFDQALTKYGKTWARTLQKQGSYVGRTFSDAMRDIISGEMADMVNDVADAFGRSDGIQKYVERLGGAADATDRLRANLERMKASGAIEGSQYDALNRKLQEYESTLKSLVDEEERSLRVRRESMNALQIEIAELTDGSEEQARVTRELNALHIDLAESMAKVNGEYQPEVVDEATYAMQRRAREIERELQLNAESRKEWDDHWDALARQFTAETQLTGAVQRDNEAREKRSQGLERETSLWKSLSANTRQWTLIIGAVLAGGGEIAALGSAVGSSLTVAAGAFGAAAIGAGTLVAAFQGLLGEVSDLPEPVREAAQAWQDLGGAFDLLQDKIQIAALDQAAGAFESLKGTVEALTPAFELVAEAGGRVIDAFAASIAPGTEGFENLVSLIESSAPIFETLSGAAITFGTALGDIFVAAAPFVQIFADYLSQLATDFLAWTNSVEGAQAINDFFQNGLVLMRAIGPLIGAVAEALAGIVTPQVVAITVEFINSLAELAPLLGSFIEALAVVDVFGLLADILVAVFTAIQPLLPELETLGMLLGAAITQALLTLTPLLTDLFAAFAPLLPIIGEMAIKLVEALLPVFPPLIEAFIALIGAIIPILPSLGELAAMLTVELVSAIIELIPVILPLIESFTEMFTVIAPIMPLVIQLIQMALIPLMIATQVFLPILAKLIELFILVFNPIFKIIEPLTKNKKAMNDVERATDALEGAMDGFKSMLSGWGDTIGGIIDGVIGAIRDAIGWFQDLFNIAADAPAARPAPPNRGGGGAGAGIFEPNASGSIVTSPTRALMGEAGAEAIVPLSRPLGAVDPDVRWLSAIAQGKAGVGGGGGPTIEAGAIVVNTVNPDGRLVAESVLDRILAGALG